MDDDEIEQFQRTVVASCISAHLRSHPADRLPRFVQCLRDEFAHISTPAEAQLIMEDVVEHLESLWTELSGGRLTSTHAAIVRSLKDALRTPYEPD